MAHDETTNLSTSTVKSTLTKKVPLPSLTPVGRVALVLRVKGTEIIQSALSNPSSLSVRVMGIGSAQYAFPQFKESMQKLEIIGEKNGCIIKKDRVNWGDDNERRNNERQSYYVFKEGMHKESGDPAIQIQGVVYFIGKLNEVCCITTLHLENKLFVV